MVAAYNYQPFIEAIIIGGSVAKGCAREDSDVDFMMLVKEEEYIKREAVNDLFINRTDLCDYPKGYVDGKIISWDYLKLVAEKGNEPTRAAFDTAFPAFNKDGNLLDQLHKIQRYPEEGREADDEEAKKELHETIQSHFGELLKRKGFQPVKQVFGLKNGRYRRYIKSWVAFEFNLDKGRFWLEVGNSSTEELFDLEIILYHLKSLDHLAPKFQHIPVELDQLLTPETQSQALQTALFEITELFKPNKRKEAERDLRAIQKLRFELLLHENRLS